MVKKKKKKEEEPDNKKPKTKKTKKRKEEKETLIDLVEAADLPLHVIIMDLSRTGLDKQLEEEIILKNKGLEIPKTITKTEFNKIIGEVR